MRRSCSTFSWCIAFCWLCYGYGPRVNLNRSRRRYTGVQYMSITAAARVTISRLHDVHLSGRCRRSDLVGNVGFGDYLELLFISEHGERVAVVIGQLEDLSGAMDSALAGLSLGIFSEGGVLDDDVVA